MFRPNPTAGYQGFLYTGYHELLALGLKINEHFKKDSVSTGIKSYYTRILHDVAPKARPEQKSVLY